MAHPPFNTLDETNPIKLVYDGLWACLEGFWQIDVLIKKGNLRKYSEAFRDPEKHAELTADCPELAVLSLGSLTHPNNTSNSSELQWIWSIEVITGAKNLEVVTALDWMIYQALSHWRDYLRPLRWRDPDHEFFKELRALDTKEQIEMAESRRKQRAPKGWTSLWNGRTRMVFATATVQQE